jgi:hypothetical protein
MCQWIFKCLPTAILLTQEATAAFNRQRWAAQLKPLVATWDQLLAAAPPSLQQQAKQLPGAAGAFRGGSAGSRSPVGSSNGSAVDTFVELERAHAGVIVGVVQATMSALSKAFTGVDPVTPTVQVRTWTEVMTKTAALSALELEVAPHFPRAT